MYGKDFFLLGIEYKKDRVLVNLFVSIIIDDAIRAKEEMVFIFSFSENIKAVK